MFDVLDAALDLIFPPRCAACRGRGALLCPPCRAACRMVPPAANSEQHRRLASAVLRSTAGAYVFEGAVREAIHTLKYDRKRRMAQPLADLLAAYLQLHPRAVDAIVPLPLHPRRQQQRGFNQAALLAEELSRRIGVPLVSDLIRVRETAQQADLSRAERRINVRDAFWWQAPDPAPRRVLLIDDVLTTGATMDAAAHALHVGGAREIHALALARGL